jgi:type II secretory pathway component HofQ
MRRNAIPVVVAVLLLAMAAAAERSVQVYEPKHRLAEDLLPLALTGLGDRGSATVDPSTNTLLLVGEPEAVRETVALLQMQDVRPRTVVIRHEIARTTDLERSGVRVAWNVGSNDVRVGNVVFPDGAARIAVGVGGQETERTERFTGTVRILEGSSGVIATGRSVPVQTRGRWHADTTLVTAESGFEATPRILGDGQVRIELVPTRAEVDARGNVAFIRAATVVMARPGETIAIGGSGAETNAARSGAWTGRGAESGRDSSVLLLTVEVEGD